MGDACLWSRWTYRDRTGYNTILPSIEFFIGTVKIIFQPAEEGGGAKPMIEAGVLKNPDVDAIVGLHLWNNLPLGTVGVRSGALMAAVECFRAHILSKGTRCDAASNRRFGCCCCKL